MKESCKHWLACLSIAFALGCSSENEKSNDNLATLKTNVLPKEIAGYGDCKHPACADIARACDDLLRSGCAMPFTQSSEKINRSHAKYTEYLTQCTGVSYSELQSVAVKGVRRALAKQPMSALDTATRTKERLAIHAIAAEAARCTRIASTCQERFDCLRGLMQAPKPPFPVPSASVNPAPPPPQPEWQKSYRGGEKEDPFVVGPPWKNTHPDAGIELFQGVDSLSCARCAMERCPNYAFKCFAAGDDGASCPNGDCCHSFRRCVQACGGYGPSASPTQFFQCSAMCQQRRPAAVQELANLQNCAKVACENCESYDQAVELTPDFGVRYLPQPSSADAGSEVSP